jgi:ribosome-associated protein
MKSIQFTLNEEHIRVCDLLKAMGLANSGAQGKHLVADGLVRVDGQLESRKTAKIRAGQSVQCRGTLIMVSGTVAGIVKAGDKASGNPVGDNPASASAVAGVGDA